MGFNLAFKGLIQRLVYHISRITYHIIYHIITI